MSEFRIADRLSLSTKTLFIGIFLLGLLLRFLLPDLKLLHHDEAIHAWYSYKLITEGSYLYDPVYHGPLLYYLTGAAFLLFKDSDLIVRLLPAVFGTAIIPLFWILYREGWLSRNHALFGALFFALSPTMVYFSRFLRHDIFQLFFTVLLLVSLLIYFDKGKWQYAIVAAISSACGLCLKEDMPLTLLIFGSFFAFMIAGGRFTAPTSWRRDLGAGLVVMAGIGLVCYTTFFIHPEMFLQAPMKAIEHWMAVQGECRICGAPWYYLMLMAVYEIPLVILAIIGIFQWGIKESGFSQLMSLCSHYLKKGKIGSCFYRNEGKKNKITDKSGIIIIFALYWAICSIFLYAFIGEKVPWLLIHQLFPIILLASYDLSGKKAILAILFSVFLLLMTLHVCYTPVDINEPIVQAQNSEDLRQVMNLIAVSNMSVVTTDAYWPLPWYFRGESWKKIVLLAQKPDPSLVVEKNPDLVIMLSTNSYKPESLPGYQKERYVYNYSFSLPLVWNKLPEWYVMRDGEKLTSNLDVFSKTGIPRTPLSP